MGTAFEIRDHMNRQRRAHLIRPCTILLVSLVLIATLVPVGLTQRGDDPAQEPTRPTKVKGESAEYGPWTLDRIGNAKGGTTIRKSPGIQIRGASEGFGPTRDSLHFLSQEVSGDFEISVRLDGIDDIGLAGLMVRVSGNDGTESFFSITAHRTSDQKAIVSTLFRPFPAPPKPRANASLEPAFAFPVYLKLQRIGTVFVSSVASDGFNYREQLRVDSKGSPLATRELNVGMVQSSENSKIAAVASFQTPHLRSTEPPHVSELVSFGVKGPLVAETMSSGAVVRSVAAAGVDDVVFLKSDTDAVKVPKKVMFERGRPTATFEVQTRKVKKPKTANLTATLNGRQKTIKIDVMPQEAVASITVRPSQFASDEPRAIATVDLVHPAPRGGTKVQISNNGRNVKVPEFVIVPAGERSVSFDIFGRGLKAGYNILTVTAGGASRSGLVDLGSIGLPQSNVDDCPLQPLTPDVATDGQRVYLSNDTQEGARVFLTGYRYDNAPPSRAFPQGEGRERTYCGCQRVKLEVRADPDGVVPTKYPYFVIPMDAPSGDYTAVVKPKDGDCPAGGIGTEACQDDGCTATNLFVAPSFIISRLNRMDINGNSEDSDDHPAEMSFTFGSFSGTPIAQGSNPLALVEFSGSYPGGAKGSGHLTNADHTQVYPELPLFIGRESKMINIDCMEECAAFPKGRQADCFSICSDYVRAGRFSDHFEFTFGGVEFDSSPSKWWGYAAGVGTAALGCFLSAKAGQPVTGCSASLTLGAGTSKVINDAIKDDDDKLGTNSQTYHHALGGMEWGPPNEQGPFKLGGDRDGGDIDLYVQNFRVGGPRILQYTVSLKSITVLEGYENGDCEEPNEVFLHSRAYLHQGGSQLDGTTRFPSAEGTRNIRTGDTEDFGGIPLVLKTQTFTPETAPESPLLFVELGVWEDDEEKDLMGLSSSMIFLPDLLSQRFPYAVNEVTPEGLFVRRAKMLQNVQVTGYEDSDKDCYGGIMAVASDPDENQARVNLEYEIEVTWLRQALR